MTTTLHSNDVPAYLTTPVTVSDGSDNLCIERALAILDTRLTTSGIALTSAEDVKRYLRLRLHSKTREVFAVLFCDSQHRLIEYDEMFSGTINAATVYPREVARKALLLNAAAIIIAHNHPSGDPAPSTADKNLTTHISKSLSLFDMRLLDHIIIGGAHAYSFTEGGDL